MAIKYPSISISFKTAAQSAIQRGDRGIVALILKDAVGVKGNYMLQSVADIPAGLSAANKLQIQLAFMGGVYAPVKVIAVVQDSALSDYAASETYLETVKWDYLAVPSIISGETAAMVAWVKGLRDNKGLKVKAVLPNVAGDSEGIINFATDNISVGATTYTTAQYCSRMAGILAGTPLTTSATFQKLPEVTDVPHLIKSDIDTAVGAGKLILVNDGRQVKIARAVNSLQTLSTDKTESFKKIKIVDILDMVYSDIVAQVEDGYIGRVSNSYDNKQNLVAAINGYFAGLELQGILSEGANACAIDFDATKAYVAGQGEDILNMSDREIREYNTGSSVFITAGIKPLDAMEDISLVINL